MREILFRAKSIGRGEWVYGWYGMYPFGRWPLKACITPAEEAIDGYLLQVEVDPATVGQFTGLVDKDGVKIFEGDIIRWTDWNGNIRKAPVKHDSEWNRFCVWINGAESNGVNRHLSNEIKVIGNIHDTEDAPCNTK